MISIIKIQVGYPWYAIIFSLKKGAVMLKEFKEFISKGNVLEMAIGIIVGAAFKAIVDSLVADILTPVLNVVTGGIDFKSWVISAGPMNFAIGNFINTIVSFLIIAFVMFLIVKAFNKMKRQEVAAEPTTKTCPYCKSEIALDATRCPHCTSELQ